MDPQRSRQLLFSSPASRAGSAFARSIPGLGIFPWEMAARVSCNRRREAAGRILYYHRVNDENDPFFPAISTELFEQEMRYIAGHYKVASMTELLDRLEGGSPEPVVAITFDDGYRDNYQNAFPIFSATV